MHKVYTRCVQPVGRLGIRSGNPASFSTPLFAGAGSLWGITPTYNRPVHTFCMHFSSLYRRMRTGVTARFSPLSTPPTTNMTNQIKKKLLVSSMGRGR